MDIVWVKKEWVDTKHEGRVVYYEAVVGNRRCLIALLGRDRRSLVMVSCEVFYDNGWHQDSVRESVVCRYKDAVRYAENWLQENGRHGSANH